MIALWNYLATPLVFTEPGFETREIFSRTPKGAVLSGSPGVLLQMSDIKPIANAPKEKNNDR